MKIVYGFIDSLHMVYRTYVVTWMNKYNFGKTYSDVFWISAQQS